MTDPQKPDWYFKRCKFCKRPAAEHAKLVGGKWFFYLCAEAIKLPEFCPQCGEKATDQLRWTTPEISVLGSIIRSPFVTPDVLCEESGCPLLESGDEPADE